MKPSTSSRDHILRRVYQMAAGRRDGKYWDEAWEHIKDHISEAAGRDKPTHSVFVSRYRTRDGVAELIMQAASKPSDTESSFLTGPGGTATGAPCLIIRRWFNMTIGTCNGSEIDTLWVIADSDGKLVSAFPRAHPRRS